MSGPSPGRGQAETNDAAGCRGAARRHPRGGVPPTSQTLQIAASEWL
jgi:hypothetical protein